MALKQANALKTMGLPEDQADALSAKLVDAEVHVDPKTLALFARFEGTVMVEDTENHSGHDAHKGAWKMTGSPITNVQSGNTEPSQAP